MNTELNKFSESLIGKTEQEVRSECVKHNLDFRTVYKNGDHYIITMDLKSDRLNFTIENDIITEVDFG